MIDHTEWLNLSAVAHQAAKNAGVEFRGLSQTKNGEMFKLHYMATPTKPAELRFKHDWKEESYFRLRDRLTAALQADSPTKFQRG